MPIMTSGNATEQFAIGGQGLLIARSASWHATATESIGLALQSSEISSFPLDIADCVRIAQGGD
jgi:hypothetical protein